MKNSVLRESTCWINGLLISFVLAITLFFMSLILFSIDIHYSLNPNLNFSNLDSIAFPIQLVFAITTIMFSIYFGYNSVWWTMISLRSTNKRKLFNFIISIFSIIFTSLLLIDSFYRCYYLFLNMIPFLEGKDLVSGNPVFVLQLWNINPNQPLPFLILILTLLATITYIGAFFFQKIFFKSESFENAQDSTQNHYTNNLIKDKKRIVEKSKPKNLTKRLTVF